MITGLEGCHCHVCGEFRLDARIAVHRIALPGTLGSANVRYCNDREECRDAAQAETMPYAHANLKAARLMREYQEEDVKLSWARRWLRSMLPRWGR